MNKYLTLSSHQSLELVFQVIGAHAQHWFDVTHSLLPLLCEQIGFKELVLKC